MEKEVASLILGTTFTSLWLLRSRPDQVHDECMRGVYQIAGEISETKGNGHADFAAWPSLKSA